MSVETNSGRKKAMEVLLAQVQAGEVIQATDAVAVWPTDPLSMALPWLDACKAFQGSLDAFLALLDAVLPGHEITHLGQHESGWMVALARLGPPARFEGEHPDNPARAGLTAILKALIAEDRT